MFFQLKASRGYAVADGAGLLAQAELLDAGFDRPVHAQMIGTLGRFADDEVPLRPEQVAAARRFFASWIREL